jgi:hypothetical protein
MGIEEAPTAPRSPWQNPYAERIIGSIRRECLNHLIVLGERHALYKKHANDQFYMNRRRSDDGFPGKWWIEYLENGCSRRISHREIAKSPIRRGPDLQFFDNLTNTQSPAQAAR